MNPSYCRIRVPRDEAIRRFADWNRIPQPAELVHTNMSNVIRLAVDDGGGWKGNAVFVSDLGEWTLLQDLSGCLSAISAKSWLEFAKSDNLVFAGYNDAIGYGELVVVEAGSVRRAFFYDAQAPHEKIDVGNLGPDVEPLKTWVEVASIVDEDDLGFSDDGCLWVY